MHIYTLKNPQIALHKKIMENYISKAYIRQEANPINLKYRIKFLKSTE